MDILFLVNTLRLQLLPFPPTLPPRLTLRINSYPRTDFSLRPFLIIHHRCRILLRPLAYSLRPLCTEPLIPFIKSPTKTPAPQVLSRP
ncbi:hypothetical protein C8J55DRAFT_45036 [Lentinula edodes]|uniref:Uncharacterized protein n=1 Tax=Lentinula lateritia TaxID=40482 RepID=A0A9W9AHC9_9AGAR|nr:hypothetical protein C8J55DRAFT_45036 [Lentinula edodes]